MALEGAIEGVKKTELSEEKKFEWKDFYQWHKKRKMSNNSHIHM